MSGFFPGRRKRLQGNKEVPSHSRLSEAFHPYLFVLYPVFFLYSQNLRVIGLSELAVPVVASLVITVLLVLFWGPVFKDRRKASIFVSILVVGCFLFGPAEELIAPFFIRRHRLPLLGVILLLTFCLSFLTLWRGPGVSSRVTRALNYLALIMLAMPMIGIAASFGVSPPDSKVEPAPLGTADPNLPSIYYIILDGRGRSDILEKHYHYSDRELLGFLREEGFYVAPESRSNYAWTWPSLASSMNLNYIPALLSGREEQLDYIEKIKNSEILRLLSERGYRFVNIGSGFFSVGQNNPRAHVNLVRQSFSELDVMLLQQTPLLPLGMLLAYRDHRNSILFALKSLETAANIEGPKFVFAHLMTPHDPFVLQADGTPVSALDMLWKGDARKRTRLYRQQVAFLDSAIRQALSGILSRETRPPLVILQSDHGPLARYRGISNYAEISEEAAPELYLDILKERLAIFLAVHWPDGGNSVAYESVTPVNVFRLLMNYYFSAGYELLPDRSFASKYAGHGTEFIDVTEKLKKPRGGKAR